MPFLVDLEKRGDLWNEGVVWIRISEKGTDRKEDLRDSESRRPLLLENVETDAAISANVAMVYSGSKIHLGRLEWIVGGELNIQEEYPTLVRGAFRPHDCCLPGQ